MNGRLSRAGACWHGRYLFGPSLGLIVTLSCLPDVRAANVGNAPQLGTHYYAIVNLDLPDPMGPGAVILRGTTGSAGIAHDLVIVQPDTHYREWILDPRNGRVAVADYTSSGNGSSFKFPPFTMKWTASPDTDGDGIHDLGEFIVGTDPNNPDTDGDGIPDGVELQNGTNPLDGRPAAVGLIATQDTPGNAVDVTSIGGLVAVADGSTGAVLFDVRDPTHPVRAAQVDTPGDAKAVAFGRGLLAVADGNGGLAVIDIADPPAAMIVHQLALGADANAVTTDGPIAYVGLADGTVVAVDLASGTILDRKKVASTAIQDVVLGHEALYVLVAGTLFTVDLTDGTLGPVVSTASSGGIGAGGRRLRLSFGEDRLYASFTFGVNVFSLANPLAPTLVKNNTTPQAGWNQLVPNGSGLALAAVGPNSTTDGAHDISLYKLESDGSITFNTTITTPGLAYATAIYNGLAYVADGSAGLEVANYLAYDALHQAPTIALSASFPLDPTPQAEEGKRVRVSAAVTDDVQVRNVVFLVNGAVAGNDGGFPFEMRFTTPQLTATTTSFTLQARAFDTGGNMAESPLYTVALVPDATPPRVKRSVPANNAYLGEVTTVHVFFSEPIKTSTLTAAALRIRGAGADGQFNTADDPTLPAAAIAFRNDLNDATLTFASSLPLGLYRIEATNVLTDLAGNALAPEYQSTFTVLGFVDQDQDGVADVLEIALGLDPTKPDTDGDGILDGQEDSDGDGLSNALEALYGTSLSDKDTDFDNLPDGAEINGTTDPLNPDTDGDGWSDGEEVKDGSNPLLASSTPSLTTMAQPRVDLETFAAEEGIAVPVGAVIAHPAADLETFAAEEGVAVPVGAVVAHPAADLETSAAEEGVAAPVGTVIGRPTAQLETTAAEEGVSAPSGTVVAHPPATAQISP